MSRTPDTPAVARRRERERRVISQMIALYCRGNHAGAARTETAFCGEPVCPACAELDAFAPVMRFAGPRMLLHHPVAAVRHILGR